MIRKFAIAIAAPLLLLGCILSPGKFTSTMTINADRTFAFTYKGEVIAIDPGSGLKDSTDKSAGDGSETTEKPDVDRENKNREIAAALAKEYGYRSVVYQGKGKFLIDYAINGTLTHNFTYPFNSDAEAVFPFIVIELRTNKNVRVKAPGYANSGSNNSGAPGGMGGAMNESSKLLDGTFTLDTDAEIISQNNEDGTTTVSGRRVITWRATPLTKDPPTAVLRLSR
jgi:hypothetical protein